MVKVKDKTVEVLVRDYHLQPWSKVKYSWQILEYIKTDWAYSKWRLEDWTIVTWHFNWLIKDWEYYIPYTPDN